MKIKPFAVEEWMNAYENGARFNIAETCCDSISLQTLLDMTGTDPSAFFEKLASRRLTYGHIAGSPDLLKGISQLYRTMTSGEILPFHGAAGANHHVFYSLIEPGDHVISVCPTYQQLYDIPRSLGAEVTLLPLRRENRFLPDPDELKALLTPRTRMICLNNPNNPSGALMDPALLEQFVRIADSIGAYILCDEVYRHLTQTDTWSVSCADLYDRALSVGSMSKVFSLAGLRLGWIAVHDSDARRALLSHRDYNLISCGILDEAVASLALKHAGLLLQRNQQLVRDHLGILRSWVQKEPHLSFIPPEAGTTALVDYDYALDSQTFAERLYREEGVLVTPGSCFMEEHCVRIGYACDRDSLVSGLTAFSAFLRRLEAEGKSA